MILLVLVALAWWSDERRRAGEVEPHAAARGVYQGVCVNVVDGDTLDVRAVSGEEFRLRLLGVDCMETHNEEKLAGQARRLGLSASEVRRLGEKGKRRTRELILNRDISWEVPHGTPLFDPYDRMLAYVQVDGRDLGAQLLGEGLAEVRRDPHPRSADYRRMARPLRP